jgi:glycosyltransferase involved in cell wall biosynthesis
LKLPISLCIVTKNEETNLRRCLRSAADLASELVVLDSGSEDGTEAVAREFGAQWHTQAWLGYRDQKNAALALCTQPWVLALDADEELSAELRNEIRTFFQGGGSESYSGASFPRKVHFLGRWITHGDWYPDRKLRLVRREGAQWAGSPEHDFMQLPPGAQQLKMQADLHHYSFPTMQRFVDKIGVFSDEYLKRQLTDKSAFSALQAVTRPFWRFFRAYILRRGFLDGFPGFWIAISTAYQAFVRHTKLYEHEQREKSRSK